MKKLAEVIAQYRQSGKAIPAFNIDCFEIYQAIEKSVRETMLPCLVQLSANEDVFIEAERLFMLVQKARLDGLPIYLNMDHGHDIARLKKLITLGFDMVHFDGSNQDYATNQLLARDMVEFAHYHQSLVEVEFDQIKPSENQEEIIFTSPVAAKEFIDITQADLLAVSVGSKHGAIADQPENINLQLLSVISSKLTKTYLTLHGGSGIELSQIKAAIQLGIVKININTFLRHTFYTSLAKSMASTPSNKIYELFSPVINDLVIIVKKILIDYSSP